MTNAHKTRSSQAPASHYTSAPPVAQAFDELLGAPGSPPLAVIAWNADGRVTGWNQGAEELLGWTEQEAVGLAVYDLVPESMRARMQQIAKDLHEGQHSVYSVNENITREGTTLLCEWHNILLRSETGEPIAVVSTARDVTRQRQIERERERFIAITAASSADRTLDEILLLVRNAVIEVEGFDRAGIWLKDDDAMRGTWGTDISGCLRDEHHERYDLDVLVGAMRSVGLDRQPYACETYQTDIRTDTGAPVMCSCVVIGMVAHGVLVGLLCVDNLLTGRPISESGIEGLLPFCEQAAVAIENSRLMAERTRLLDRKRRMMEIAAAINTRLELDKILRMVRDAVVDVAAFDRAGVVLVEGDYARGSWGTDRAGQVRDEHDYRAPLTDWFPHVDELKAGDQSYILRELRDPEADTVYPCANVLMRVDGELVGVLSVDNLMTHRPILEENIEMLLHFTEQTAVAIRNARLFGELQQAQEALLRSEKLRAVGELASGVAHNVNNVLAAVLGYSELIQGSDGVPAEVAHYARTIERAALDGAEIVRRVQRFARRETEAGQIPFDVAVAVQEAIDLTRPAWQNQALGRGVHIDIVKRLTPGMYVLGYASEIREVLVNIIKNAVDAMPDGGTLTIGCVAEGEQAIITVKDTGLGMSEETRKRVFEPFFSTKGAGLGTGLGLSVAWGILDRHNGRIEAQSAPGAGSQFIIRMARVDAPTVEERVPVSDKLNGLRLLLVEDEELVMSGLARMLIARGATVDIGENADEALAWLEDHADKCDIVLTDHGMVGMTGMKLLAVVRDRYPHIRRVLLSGWGTNLPDGEDVSAAERILGKPIRLDELSIALNQLPPRTLQ